MIWLRPFIKWWARCCISIDVIESDATERGFALISIPLCDCFRSRNSKYDGHHRLRLFVQIFGAGRLECGQNELFISIHRRRIQFQILVHRWHWFPWKTNGMRSTVALVFHMHASEIITFSHFLESFTIPKVETIGFICNCGTLAARKGKQVYSAN